MDGHQWQRDLQAIIIVAPGLCQLLAAVMNVAVHVMNTGGDESVHNQGGG